MPCKYIVKIEKGDIAMEVEVMARTPREARVARQPAYMRSAVSGIQWRINPSDGKRILCS